MPLAILGTHITAGHAHVSPVRDDRPVRTHHRYVAFDGGGKGSRQVSLLLHKPDSMKIDTSGYRFRPEIGYFGA